MELVKRTHVYVKRPIDYEIAGCECGNSDPDWSEFQGHLWCQNCKIDFQPKHDGIFDGPIPVETMRLLGAPVDIMLNLATGKVEQMIERPEWKK